MNELEQRSAVRAHLLPILLLQSSSSKLISFMELIIKYGFMSRHRIYLKISCHPFYLSDVFRCYFQMSYVSICYIIYVIIGKSSSFFLFLGPRGEIPHT